MKKLAATALVIWGVLLGPNLLKAQEAKSRIPYSQYEKRIVQVKKDSPEDNKDEQLSKMLSAMNAQVRKLLLNLPLQNYNSASAPHWIRPENEYEKNNLKPVTIGLKKEIKPEDEVIRGASANLYLDKYRNAERFDAALNYGSAGIKVQHNLMARTGNVTLTVGQKNGLEVILSDYKNPLLNAHAQLGKNGRVSAFYDPKNKDFMTNVSANYKGASINVNWMPRRKSSNTTVSYALPEEYNDLIKSVAITSTNMGGIMMRKAYLDGSVGFINFNVGAINLGSNKWSSTYKPFIQCYFRKSF